MRNRMIAVWLVRIVTVAVLCVLAPRAYAANILISGNSMDPSNANLTNTLAGLGHQAVFVAPFNFAATSLAGVDAVWLDGFSQYGGGTWPANLVAFLTAGGNVFVQSPGFGSEPVSMYPLGAQLTSIFTFPPGEDQIAIVD